MKKKSILDSSFQKNLKEMEIYIFSSKQFHNSFNQIAIFLSSQNIFNLHYQYLKKF
jgi:hypothetical protein